MDNNVIIAYNRHIQFVYVYFLSKIAVNNSTKNVDKKQSKWYYYEKRGEEYMVIEELNVLKKKLEDQVLKNDPYDKIYETSTKIDDLLIEYYENIGKLKKESLDNDIKKNLSC